MLHELISLTEFTKICVVMAIATPCVGLIWVWRWPQGRRQAILAALLGPVNLVLWTIYSRITAHLGLDTVRNLVINAALFVTLGLLGGIGYGLYLSRTQQKSDQVEELHGSESG